MGTGKGNKNKYKNSGQRQDFCKVAQLVKEKKHLQIDGINKIILPLPWGAAGPEGIKDRMNTTFAP